MVDKVIVLLSSDERSVDLVAKVFDAHVLVVVGRNFRHQFGGVLPRRKKTSEFEKSQRRKPLPG